MGRSSDYKFLMPLFLTHNIFRELRDIHKCGFGEALYIYRFEIMILLRVKAKSLLCYWVVRDLDISMAQIARQLNLSLAGVSQSVKRGETIVQ